MRSSVTRKEKSEIALLACLYLIGSAGLFLLGVLAAGYVNWSGHPNPPWETTPVTYYSILVLSLVATSMFPTLFSLHVIKMFRANLAEETIKNIANDFKHQIDR